MARTKQIVKDRIGMRRVGKTSKVDKQAPAKAGKAKPADGEVKQRKPHRWRAGTEALREIKRQQKSTKLMVQSAPFRRMVVAAMLKASEDWPSDTVCPSSVTPGAIDALQTFTEQRVLYMYQQSLENMLHRKGTKLSGADWNRAKRVDALFRMNHIIGA
jgi:histone H3